MGNVVDFITKLHRQIQEAREGASREGNGEKAERISATATAAIPAGEVPALSSPAVTIAGQTNGGDGPSEDPDELRCPICRERQADDSWRGKPICGQCLVDLRGY